MPLAVLWLLLSGRTATAVMLSAFALPVLIEGARRWGRALRPLMSFRHWRGPLVQAPAVDPALAERCAVLLKAYLEQSGRQLPLVSGGTRVAGAAADGTAPRRMSAEQALEVLGLEPGATASAIREAHRRLTARLQPEIGGSRHLALQIDEAKGVLLGH
jgi:hypothetical protein